MNYIYIHIKFSMQPVDHQNGLTELSVIITDFRLTMISVVLCMSDRLNNFFTNLCPRHHKRGVDCDIWSLHQSDIDETDTGLFSALYIRITVCKFMTDPLPIFSCKFYHALSSLIVFCQLLPIKSNRFPMTLHQWPSCVFSQFDGGTENRP